jgi:hypothetical protein
MRNEKKISDTLSLLYVGISRNRVILASINLGIQPGGARMMRFRVLILTVLIMTCVVHLQATSQPIDPRLIINGGHFLGPSEPVGLDFTFMANSSGGGMFTFTNDSGQNWTSLEIETPPPTPSYAITCGGTSFAHCEVLFQPESDSAIVDFFGGGGILSGDMFRIDLGNSGWPPNGEFHAFANIPEPGTLALSLIGLAPLLARRFNHFGMRNR